jgi:hypothetical protein
MRLDAKEGLTESDENCKMKDKIRSQLPKLNLVHMKETPEKLVSGERKPTVQEGHEHHSKTGRRVRA